MARLTKEQLKENLKRMDVASNGLVEDLLETYDDLESECASRVKLAVAAAEERADAYKEVALGAAEEIGWNYNEEDFSVALARHVAKETAAKDEEIRQLKAEQASHDREVRRKALEDRRNVVIWRDPFFVKKEKNADR